MCLRIWFWSSHCQSRMGKVSYSFTFSRSSNIPHSFSFHFSKLNNWNIRQEKRKRNLKQKIIGHFHCSSKDQSFSFSSLFSSPMKRNDWEEFSFIVRKYSFNWPKEFSLGLIDSSMERSFSNIPLINETNIHTSRSNLPSELKHINKQFFSIHWRRESERTRETSNRSGASKFAKDQTFSIVHLSRSMNKKICPFDMFKKIFQLTNHLREDEEFHIDH